MPYDLTARELEVLRVVARAGNEQEAANLLFVSILTVQEHLTNIAAKLGEETGEQALDKARREGLL